MSKKKKEVFDPDEPMELVMERLEPYYRDEKERELAKTNPFVEEEAKRSAYAILRNGGATNQEELDALILTGWKPAKRTPKSVTPPKNEDDLEGDGE